MRPTDDRRRELNYNSTIGTGGTNRPPLIRRVVRLPFFDLLSWFYLVKLLLILSWFNPDGHYHAHDMNINETVRQI